MSTSAQSAALAHGLWVWKGPSVLADSNSAEDLRDFCQSQGINEVYISVAEDGDPSTEARYAHLIFVLHRSNIRIEALVSSSDADEPGKSRVNLLDHVLSVTQFNQNHANNRFDGVHLDIEPQQRPENKGDGNVSFLPNLIDAYRAVRAITDPSHLTVDADIPRKLLRTDAAQRRALLTSVPRLTLMLYRIDTPSDGQSTQQQMDKLRAEGQNFLQMAYDGLSDDGLAKISIALRTPDYGTNLPQMLKSLDDANRANPHYTGWSRHSYNDILAPVTQLSSTPVK